MGNKDSVSAEAEAIALLTNLAKALDAAFISSWQSTAYWQGELDDALEFLKELESRNG